MLLTGEDGQSLPPRRDPYARHTEFDSAWCFVDDAAAFDWRHPWEPPPFDEYLIYEVQPPPWNVLWLSSHPLGGRMCDFNLANQGQHG